MEATFEPLKGVKEVDSGYMGGNPLAANYNEILTGNSGHYEVVKVRYETTVITYEKLLKVFWKNIDPTDARGQFVDRDKQYQIVIFYGSASQKKLAKKSKINLEKSGKFKKKIAAKIKPIKEFFRAENYHQDYFKKNSIRYQLYKKAQVEKIILKKHGNSSSCLL